MQIVPEIPGAVLIVKGDTVLADVATAGCAPHTRFQIASLSKQFTAAAVLLLAQRGVLALDDRIGRWVEGGPPSWRAITLHQLLAHTSGLGHWDEYPMIDLFQPMEPSALLEAFHAVPPLFAAGGGWHYSSPGYVLLAHVVEQATGRPYRGVLAADVFAPLDMAATFAGSPGQRPDVAPGHDGAGRPVPSFDLDVVGMGAGDVWSTTGDLVRWIDGLRAGRLLDERHRALMLTEHATTGAGPGSRGYGYGWFVGSVAGEPWFHHDGANAGFRAYAACLPTSDRRVVVLSNSEATNMAVFNDVVTAALRL
ncbi:serine hydrolase [Streptomyces sp. SID8379]|uniref:serine hydrolase domain-containing protein n=1 Tax=unclassified Streptomyces TaxID=2593676 RepID=UPI0003773E4A|nr:MULTISPECIES: serine hydrolase domain-containing protein [unclassified Streptomyces]MYW69774.1 serine hydrolase [Streptomyces sp. SID8379]